MSGQMASVRRAYGVPAYKGREVTFRGYPIPTRGRIISSTGSHLWLRLHNGKRFGPLHPTWEMDYGDGRDWTGEGDAIIEVRNDWLNRRIDAEECRARVDAIREHWPRR